MKYKIAYIYALVEPVTEEIRYIGKTTNPKRRLIRHLSDARINDSYKDKWLRKLKNQGLKPTLEILDEVPHDEWVFWEKHWISLCKSWGLKLTNGNSGGIGGGASGYKWSEESKLKLSESKKGKAPVWWNPGQIRTEEHKENLSKANKGRISPNKNKTYTEEHKSKLRDASTVKKAVLQLDMNDNLIKEWISVNEIQKTLNITHISECCRGIVKTVKGFKWKYKND